MPFYPISGWSLLLFIFVFCTNTDAQQVFVSSYFNPPFNTTSTQSDEWTELLVSADNLNLVDWSIQDNNQTQTSWITPALKFKNVPLWTNVGEGTAIIIWHRQKRSDNTDHALDTISTDGYIEVWADDPRFFYGANISANQILNLSYQGDLIRIVDNAGNEVHALGHIPTPPAGGSFLSLTCPALNHAASLPSNTATTLFVVPGNDPLSWGNPPTSGTTFTKTAIGPSTFGLPNSFSPGFTTQNSDYWRALREPEWTPQVAATSSLVPNQIVLNWTPVPDPNTSDNTVGYIIVRNSSNSFSTPPADGHTYLDLDPIGTATVIGHTNSNSFIDINIPNCGSTVYYRIYAYRYTTDNINGNDFNVARGRAYNQLNYATASFTVPAAPAAQTMTGNTSYCSGTSGVAIGLANSEAGVNYQLYIDCPVPNTPVGSPIAGIAGNAISFGNQTIPTSGPCTFSVVASFAAFPACSISMLNTITVTVLPTPTFTLTSTGPSTCGGTDGTITLNGLAASTAYVVNYSFNGTPATPLNITSNATGSLVITGLPAGNYTAITVTLAGCPSAPASVTLNDPPTPAAPTITAPQNTICSGQSVTLTANGCSGTVGWNTGASTSSITVSPIINTTYTATCTENGCVSPASAPFSITVNVSPVISSVFPTNPSTCGGSDGTISLGGLQPSTTYAVNYLFNGVPVGPLNINSDVGGNLVIMGLSAGSYTDITVTLNGCPSAPQTANLFDPGAPAAPTVTASLSTICEGQSTDLTATGCTGTVTWSNGATGTTITVSPTVNTDYTATCTVAGCTSGPSAIQAIIVDPLPVISAVNANNPTSCGGNDGSIDLDVLTPNTLYAVDYLFNGTAVPTQNISSNASGIITLTGLSAGNYTNITVTLNSCGSLPEATTLFDPAAPAAPTVSATSTAVCIGQSTTLTASGCAGTLQWSTGETTLSINVSPVVPTTYTVTCTVNNCTSLAGSIAISIDPGPVFGAIIPSSPSVCGGNDGALSLPGLLPSTSYQVNYQFGGNPFSLTLNTNASGTLVISNLTAGAYTGITVTLSGCTSASSSANIADPGSPAAPTISAIPATICQGGSVSLSASGCSGGTITWSNGQTGSSIIVNPASSGFFTATCTVSGCTSAASNAASVTVNNPPVITSLDTNFATNGQANGSLVSTATGTAPVEFSINGSNWFPSGNFSNLAPGSYTLSVRDGNGCITTSAFIIANSSFAGMILDADTASACPLSNVTISFYGTGINSIRSFDLCYSFDPLIASYNGITAVHPDLINVITDSSIPGRLQITWDGAANVTIPDGELVFRLRFRGKQTGLVPIEWNDFLPGICGVFNDAGAPVVFSYSAGAADFLQMPQAVISGDTELCLGEPLELTALGDTLTHVWTLPDGTLFNGHLYQVAVASIADTGSYKLLATNTIGCINKDTVLVTITAPPLIQLASQDSLCAEATYPLNPGSGYASYLWQDGSTLPTFTASGEGVYWVQVTDAAGCTGADTVSLITCPAKLHVPTAFSPNFDSYNDYFRARYSDVDVLEDFKLLIYNRWGQLLFETDNIQTGWDGTFNGENCPMGVYTYVIFFKKPEGKTMAEKSPYRGLVTLIR